MKKYFSLILFLLFGSFITPAVSQTGSMADRLILQVKVIGIKDGDTVEVLYYQLPFTVRLEHIDAPEKKQPFGTVAKKRLSDLAFGKNVTLISLGRKGNYDARGRLIAELYLNERTCINKELVKTGLAWHYKKYSSSAEYAELEDAARKNKAGLWADPHPVAPWNFRR